MCQMSFMVNKFTILIIILCNIVLDLFICYTMPAILHFFAALLHHNALLT